MGMSALCLIGIGVYAGVVLVGFVKESYFNFHVFHTL